MFQTLLVMHWKEHLKNNLINFFLSKIKLPTQVKIALPERDDRIKQAGKILSDMGLQICHINSNPQSDKHIQLLKKLDFSKNWPDKNLIEYLKNPFIASLVMLKNNEIDEKKFGESIFSSLPKFWKTFHESCSWVVGW